MPDSVSVTITVPVDPGLINFNAWGVDPEPDDKIFDIMLTDADKRNYAHFRAYEHELARAEASILERQSQGLDAELALLRISEEQTQIALCHLDVEPYPATCCDEVASLNSLRVAAKLFESAFWLSVYARIPPKWSFPERKFAVYKDGRIAIRPFRIKASPTEKLMLA